MQPIGTQLEQDLTIQQVARLLDITRTAVEKRRSKDLPVVPNTSPSKIRCDAALHAYEVALQRCEGTIARMKRAHAEFFPPGTDDSLATSSHQTEQASGTVANQLDAGDQSLVSGEAGGLAFERVGRALAEARITELTAALRRAHGAIEALNLDPDFDPDIPA